MSPPLSVAASVGACVAYFVAGVLLSRASWRGTFDLGWLVVAFLIARCAAARLEKGRLGARDYVTALWPTAPGFLLEWACDSSLRSFRLQGGRWRLAVFALLSCLLLIFITTATAKLKFGVQADELSPEDEARWRGAIWIGAVATAVSIPVGTLSVLTIRTEGPDARLDMLESWLYWASLIVYLLLTMKMMLPLVLNRLRAARSRRDFRS